MSLDRGERVEINSIKGDRSSEYVDSIKSNISSLKKEESLVREIIVKAKEDLKSVLDQGDIDISNKQKEVSILNAEIAKVKSVLIEMKESLDSVIADYEKEKKQMDDRRERFDADIANKVAVAEKRVNEKNIIIDGLVTHSEALKRSIDLLIKDKNMLSEEVKKLADKKTAIISIIDGLSVDAKELSAGVDSLNAEINRKRTELESVSNNYINLNNQCILLKSQIEALSVEKQDILNAKEENSRRAKELQEMYEDIRIEKIAQANKNASLLKREAAIKEAQTKIGG